MTSGRRTVGKRLHLALSSLVARPAAWALFVAAMAAWPVVWSLRTSVPSPPPVLSTLPAFELTDQTGRAFGSKDLEGRVWVASFIFTRCASVCPALTAKMSRIQSRTRNLAPAFHLVSFSADPEYDTPARLDAYAKSYRASPRLWSFLTGPPAVVRELAVQGLKMSLGEQRVDELDAQGISHDTHILLVDGRGQVRRYYDSEQEGVVDDIVRDAALLVNRGG
jgi:protein SCO1